MPSAVVHRAVELTDTNVREVGLKAESVNPAAITKRRVFARLSIAVGNILQIAGILAACFAVSASRSAHSTAFAVIAMVLACKPSQISSLARASAPVAKQGSAFRVTDCRFQSQSGRGCA